MLLDCSPAWVTHPPATCSTAAGSIPDRSTSPVSAAPRISAACRPDSVPPRIDLTDPDLYAQRVPQREFAELRRAAPIWWNEQRTGATGFGDTGFWAVTRHADVMEVSHNDKLFSSWENTAIIRFDEGITRDAIEMQRIIMLNTDPPHHTD